MSEEEFSALSRVEVRAGNRIVASGLSRDPESGELVETRRAGNDCSFSAPKSISFAYEAGVNGIKEAHDAAVLPVRRKSATATTAAQREFFMESKFQVTVEGFPNAYTASKFGLQGEETDGPTLVP